MKQGITFQELQEKANEYADKSIDRIISVKDCVVSHDANGQFILDNPKSKEQWVLDDNCHLQLSNKLEIPRKYYNRTKDEQPDLLALSINTWLDSFPEDAEMMMRGFDKFDSKTHLSGRAILSTRYKRIDNIDVINNILPMIKNEHEIQSCDITPFNMFLKISFPKTRMEVGSPKGVSVGDYVEGGVIISNSEIGWGSMNLSYFVHRLVCTNGMVVPDMIDTVRKNHSGQVLTHEDGDIIEGEYTIKNDYEKLEQIHNLLSQAQSEKVMLNTTESFRNAQKDQFRGSLQDGFLELSRHFLITKEEMVLVEDHFKKWNDKTRWGFANAVTRTAQDVSSYDRATELEKIGGKIIGMQSKSWHKLVA